MRGTPLSNSSLSTTKLHVALFLLVAVIGLSAGYWASQRLWPSLTTVTTTTTAPDHEVVDFELPDLEGKRIRLSRWRGKVVLVNFWATWCAPCREEIPLLVDVQKRHAGQGLQVIGVAIDQKDNLIDFRREVPMNYPTLIGQDDAIELMKRLGNPVGSLPFSVTISRAGHPIAHKLGLYRQPELDSLLSNVLPVQ